MYSSHMPTLSSYCPSWEDRSRHRRPQCRLPSRLPTVRAQGGWTTARSGVLFCNWQVGYWMSMRSWLWEGTSEGRRYVHMCVCGCVCGGCGCVDVCGGRCVCGCVWGCGCVDVCGGGVCGCVWLLWLYVQVWVGVGVTVCMHAYVFHYVTGTCTTCVLTSMIRIHMYVRTYV